MLIETWETQEVYQILAPRLRFRRRDSGQSARGDATELRICAAGEDDWNEGALNKSSAFATAYIDKTFVEHIA